MNIRDIISEYKYKTELHTHTYPASICGQHPPADVVETYCNTPANTIVITNHMSEHHFENVSRNKLADFYLKDYYDALEAAKGKGLYVALGAELRFAGTENDYLLYGISPDDIEKLVSYIYKDIYTFYKEFKNDKNVIIHAHPFRNGMEPTPFGAVDGIETFNTHPGHNSRIAFACRLAREHGMLVTGASDYHGKGREATCLMCTKSVMRDSLDVAEAIKSQDIVFDVFGHTVLPNSL